MKIHCVEKMFKIGIVGAGIIAKSHAEAIRRNQECTVVAVADIAVEKASEIAAPFDAAVYTDYHELCKKSDLDAVIINLPHFLHCEATCFFLENKVNVYVEKPMAMNVEECDKMIAVAKENNVFLGVGHVQQYTEAHRCLKKMIQSEELGKLLRVTEVRNANYFAGRPAWFLDKERSGGGIVMNLGAHTLDKLYYLTDSTLEDVCSIYTNKVNDYSIEEGAQILGRLSCGASVVCSYTGTTGGTTYETMFYFEKGVARVIASEKLSVYRNDQWEELVNSGGNMFDKGIQALVKALKGEKSDITTAEHARAVIQGIMKVYQNRL